jgi:SAM-dependent methyltransferase
MPERCAACAAASLVHTRALRRGGELLRCGRCGHRQLGDWDARPEADEFAGVDPEAYERAMSAERCSSARALVDELLGVGAKGPLLDVGCSFGWLIEVASEAGFQAFGVDPSESAVQAARSRGLQVRHGHFPEEDWERGDWGVVTYMDVLEHIADVDSAVSETVRRLRPGGLLAVQVPVSTGAVFRTADEIDRWSGGRVDGPLRRMLQMEFPYPHVHYFSPRSLQALLERFGLRPLRVSYGPIATGNFADRVSFRNSVTAGQRVEALGLRVLVAVGRVTGREDLLRVVARREG